MPASSFPRGAAHRAQRATAVPHHNARNEGAPHQDTGHSPAQPPALHPGPRSGQPNGQSGHGHDGRGDDEPSGGDRLSIEQIRFATSRVILAWVFGAIFFQLSAGAIYASFTRSLGASEAVFGFLAGAYPLMSFVQIPAARLIERRISPRALMLRAGLIGRALWLIAASLPLWHLAGLLPERALLPSFVACVVLSSTAQASIGPAFFAWTGAMVPSRVNATFWARRQQIGTFAGIGAVIVGGLLADAAPRIEALSGGAVAPLTLYSLILIVAAACGITDIALFRSIPEPPRPLANATRLSFRASIVAPLRERVVRRYLVFSFAAMLGFATTGPLLWLHCLEVLRLDKTTTGLILTVLPLSGIALSSRVWGRVARDHGTRPMLRLASAGMCLMPLVWLFVTRDTLLLLGAAMFYSGLLFGAYELSNLRFVTSACAHLPRGPIAALFSIFAGTTFALGSWGVGALAQAWSGWSWEVAGRTFVNFHLIFALSLIPRLINALVLAPRLDEPSSSATLLLVREFGTRWAEVFSSRWGRHFTARAD